VHPHLPVTKKKARYVTAPDVYILFSWLRMAGVQQIQGERPKENVHQRNSEASCRYTSPKCLEGHEKAAQCWGGTERDVLGQTIEEKGRERGVRNYGGGERGGKPCEWWWIRRKRVKKLPFKGSPLRQRGHEEGNGLSETAVKIRLKRRDWMGLRSGGGGLFGKKDQLYGLLKKTRKGGRSTERPNRMTISLINTSVGGDN